MSDGFFISLPAMEAASSSNPLFQSLRLIAYPHQNAAAIMPYSPISATPSIQLLSPS